MNPLTLGMLVVAAQGCKRIYIGREGVFLNGFREGTSRWRPLWLWWRGYLQYSGCLMRGYGAPGVYLAISPKGRKVAEETETAVARWRAAR